MVGDWCIGVVDSVESMVNLRWIIESCDWEMNVILMWDCFDYV